MFSFAGLLCFYNKKRYLAAMNWALASLLDPMAYCSSDSSGTTFCCLQDSDPTNAPRFLLANLIRSLIVLSGFALFLAHGYYSMCMHSERPWCHRLLPNIYPFVQEHYWNVGFLRYFTLGNIPNFLLAIPMIIALYLLHHLIRIHDPKRLFFLRNTVNHAKHSLFLNQDQLVPHVLLLSFMLVYTVLVAHVQIITRLFSFMPIIPWYLAHLYRAVSNGHCMCFVDMVSSIASYSLPTIHRLKFVIFLYFGAKYLNLIFMLSCCPPL